MILLRGPCSALECDHSLRGRPRYEDLRSRDHRLRHWRAGGKLANACGRVVCSIDRSPSLRRDLRAARLRLGACINCITSLRPGSGTQRLWKLNYLSKQTGSSAVLVIDDTAIPKKGTHSVGVAAQYASGPCEFHLGTSEWNYFCPIF